MLSVIREHGEQVLQSFTMCHGVVSSAFQHLKILEGETNMVFRTFALAELDSQPLWVAGVAALKE